MNKLSLFLIFLFLITSVLAFGLINPNLPKLEAPTPTVIAFDNNTGAVNSSTYADFWDLLNTPADILTSLLNNDANWISTAGEIDGLSLHLNQDNWAGDSWITYSNPNFTFNETKLLSTYYNATNINTISGTLDAGDINSIHIPEDGDTYNVSEDVGVNPLIININFTGVTDFDSIIGRVYYDGGLGHIVQLEIQRSDTGDWENYLDLTDTTDFVNIYAPVFDPSQHIFANGDVAVRFYHVQTGMPSHNFFIDYLNIVEGWTTLTTANHDSLGGRDSVTNHPWAMPKNSSNNLTTTDTGFFGWLGSLTNRIKKLWIQDIDMNGTIQMNEGNITNATYIETKELNVTGISRLGNWTINDTGQFYNNGSRSFSIEINSTHTILRF